MERQKTTLAAYNELYKEQDDLYRGAARGFGLSDCAFWVLYALRETKRPMTQSGICAAVYQPKQTVHSALKKAGGGPRPPQQAPGADGAGGGAGAPHRRPGDGGGDGGHGRTDGDGAGTASGAAAPL